KPKRRKGSAERNWNSVTRTNKFRNSGTAGVHPQRVVPLSIIGVEYDLAEVVEESEGRRSDRECATAGNGITIGDYFAHACSRACKQAKATGAANNLGAK